MAFGLLRTLLGLPAIHPPTFSNSQLKNQNLHYSKNMKLEFESNVAEVPSFAGNYTADTESAEAMDVSRTLQAGVKAAQEGNRSDARTLLLQVTEAAPDNENAWLWLASISDYPEELLVFLNNVLNINPNNARALEWAHATKSLLAKNFVQRGVDASNEAQMDLARQCFLQAVVNDERNEMAWFWLASIADSAEEKLSHLQKVLNINPDNETAVKALQTAKSQITEALLRKANAAAIAGERETAGEMLQKILKQTPESEEAWILKSYLADSFSDKVVCFERVLSINPENDAALSGLASLRELMTRTENRKSQNLSLAAFLPEALAENQTENQSQPDSTLTPEMADNDSEYGAIVEPEAIIVEDVTEVQTAAETESAPVELENNNYFPQDEVSAQPTETAEEVEDAAAEFAPDDSVENAPTAYAGYSEQESYAPPMTGTFNLAEMAGSDYASNLAPQEPVSNNLPALKKVMVIDDSATVRKLIAQKLEMSGYEVICAADGLEALEMMTEIIPDLILLDTVMPQMDGYQVCQTLRGIEATKDVPVVMISGKDGFFDKVRGQMSGSTGYIAKPFGPETLMKTVESYIFQS